MSLTMPREIIVIRLFENAGPFEGASQLLSHIAYPDSIDVLRRNTFMAALCRLAHVKTSELDPSWGTSLQQIRPWIFCYAEDEYKNSLKHGLPLLGKRLVTAFIML